MPQPYKLFTIYAREDAQYLEELRGQLRPLEHAGRIRVWSDREINPGVDWEKEIVQNLDNDSLKIFEWEGGCEDPRIVQRDDSTYIMTYTAYDGKTARLCVASSKDLVVWKKHGLGVWDTGRLFCWLQSDKLPASC